MPSSTSSFERAVPRVAWTTAFGIAVGLTLVALVAWEARCRAAGYAPTLNDTSDLWARIRSEVSDDPEQTVIVGASRILFDFDLETYAEYFQTEKPLQLAMAGSNPLIALEHIADDESFRGTLLCGVTPGLFFAPEGPPVQNPLQAIRRYENWSPSQRVGQRVAAFLQKRLAFIQQEDLTLAALLFARHIPNRESTRGNIPPELPPYFAGTEDDRRTRMWDRCTFGSPRALYIQQVWIPLFTPPPPPPNVSEEEFREMFMQSVENHLERARTSVERLEARGAKVVFVRCPSSGTLREMETKFSPRAGFYDRILAATGAPGIHFEDHPELADFSCPEWSHLTAEDSVTFTERLMPILERVLDET